MRISDWSSDVCSSDLVPQEPDPGEHRQVSQQPGCFGIVGNDIVAEERQTGPGRRQQGRGEQIEAMAAPPAAPEIEERKPQVGEGRSRVAYVSEYQSHGPVIKTDGVIL